MWSDMQSGYLISLRDSSSSKMESLLKHNGFSVPYIYRVFLDLCSIRVLVFNVRIDRKCVKVKKKKKEEKIRIENKKKNIQDVGRRVDRVK